MKNTHIFRFKKAYRSIVLMVWVGFCAFFLIINAQAGTPNGKIGACPMATVEGFVQPSCGQEDGSITFKIALAGSGCCDAIVSVGYKINRKDPNGTVEISANSVSSFPVSILIDNLKSGLYEIVMTPVSAGTCTAIVASLMNLQPSNSNITLAESEVGKASCLGTKDGSFKLAVSGGTAPYSLSISPSSKSQPQFTQIPANMPATFDELEAGNYTITAIDKNGCSSFKTITIEAKSTANFNIETTGSQICPSSANGTVKLNSSPSGATFIWSTGSTSNEVSGLTAGTYTVTVTSNSCSKTATAIVNTTPPIVIKITKTDISCTGLADGGLSASASNGGVPPLTFAWSNSSTTNSLTGLKADAYSLTVTDAKGCKKDTMNIAIVDPGDVQADIMALPNAIVKTGSTVTLSVDTKNNNYHFNWNITDVSNALISPGTTQGTVNNKAGSVSINLTLGSNRSPGGLKFQVEPFKVGNSNCKGKTAEVSVLVLPNDDLFIPAIYTPNGDGANDDWNLVLPPDATGTVTIFNRAGGQVYKGDVHTPWNGNGCPDGTYFYVLKYTLGGQETQKKGAVTIMRTTD